MSLSPPGEDLAYRQWIREQPCDILKRRSGEWLREEQRYVVVQPAHVRTWKASREDHNNIVPLDYLLHQEQHQHGIESFQAKYQVDLQARAIAYTERYEREKQEYPF